MKIRMGIILSFLILPFAAFAAPQASKMDLTPTEKVTTPQTESETGDIDMKQFQKVPPPKRRAAKVDVNISCQEQDGTIRKKGDRGYKECIENEENRVLKQPNLPEAVPYDPRTN